PPRAPKPYGPPSPRPRICRLALLPTRLTVAASGRRAASNGTRCRSIVSAAVLVCDWSQAHTKDDPRAPWGWGGMPGHDRSRNRVCALVSTRGGLSAEDVGLPAGRPQ